MADFTFLKGNIETIILCSLYNRDKYGYEIAKDIKDRTENAYEIKQPTLYSYLKRLQDDDLIDSYWGTESNGGRRRYYKLTDLGRKNCEKFVSEWEFQRNVLSNLVDGTTEASEVTQEEVTPLFGRRSQRRRKIDQDSFDQQDELEAMLNQLEGNTEADENDEFTEEQLDEVAEEAEEPTEDYTEEQTEVAEEVEQPQEEPQPAPQPQQEQPQLSRNSNRPLSSTLFFKTSLRNRYKTNNPFSRNRSNSRYSSKLRTINRPTTSIATTKVRLPQPLRLNRKLRPRNNLLTEKVYSMSNRTMRTTLFKALTLWSRTLPNAKTHIRRTQCLQAAHP